MIHTKSIKTLDDKFIDIYDNAFEFTKFRGFYDFLRKGHYQTYGSDDFYNNQTPNQVFANFDTEILNSFGFCDSSAFDLLNKKYSLNERKINQIRVNASNSFEYGSAHADPHCITLVFYCNPSWDVFWGGHTLFFNQETTEIEYTCIYKPNRIIVFDGDIPHCISPISITCRYFRYSFVMQYFK